MNVDGHWTLSGSLVVVVVSADADEVALRRGIVNFGACGDGALSRNATMITNIVAVRKRGRARLACVE